MTDAKIDIVGPGEHLVLLGLYNQIFRPAEAPGFFDRRLGHRQKVLRMIASLDGEPVGFTIGYELRPTTYYSWLYGVLPQVRRRGIASQLMAAEHAWARGQGFEMVRFECYNQHRPMLQLAIEHGYDIVGIRWDSHTAGNLVIFEKHLLAEEE
jgi:GNAT superfamily N-acetyltransferase